MQTETILDALSAHRHLTVDTVWLGQLAESALDPGLAIVDPHHHLWDRARSPRYLLDDLLADVDSGHKVVGTVFVECRSIYRADGPKALRSIAETEFANGIAAMSASGDYGELRACAGIVASVDLRLGAQVRPAIEAHVAAGGGRLKGIRQIAAHNDSPLVRVAGPIPPPRLLADREFREGFSLLAPSNLSFDAWVYHPQLGEVADLARAFPYTMIILNHCGGPIGIGPYLQRRDQAFTEWQQGIREVASCRNVFMKLGGLGMRLGGFRFNERSMPPSSTELARAWAPYIETCIEAFGAGRCMFESNFPVEKASCSYAILWNCFKRIAAACSRDEKNDLFSRTAARTYRLDGLCIGTDGMA